MSVDQKRNAMMQQEFGGGEPDPRGPNSDRSFQVTTMAGDGATSTSPFIDWTEFWGRDRCETEWLVEPILAKGRGHALYAQHKVGKSLLTLSMVAELATMREDVVVMYLD